MRGNTCARQNPPPPTSGALSPSSKRVRPLLMRLPRSAQSLAGEVLALLHKGVVPGLAHGLKPHLRPQPEVPTPKGAQFLSRTYSCAAGSRDYKLFVPSKMKSKAKGRKLPLIVMLHGCTQNPDDFALGTGMNELAEERGCFVAYPRQSTSSNQMACWNWFNLKDQTRDFGEPSILAGMTREIMAEFNVDSDRVFVAGLSRSALPFPLHDRPRERRQTTMLEIEDGAKHYLRLKLGVAAAEQALRIYRDQHRSSMMARASEALKIISRDTYGLTIQPDRDSEILVAVGANDGSKVASDPSKGTRFQLYLALRVAGYQEFVQSRRPVPFIADDIMETFDDFRAEEAFKLFAGMAAMGQVIYLTHHRHLCDIARNVCPGVRVHELPANVS